MAIDPHIVKLATEYLDLCIANESPATLVGMHWYIDRRNKSLPLIEQVNEALLQRPWLGAENGEGGVTFTLNGSSPSVTIQDMRAADKQYRRQFATASRKFKR